MKIDRLETIAAAVADGTAVNWEAEESRASREERGIVRNLQALSHAMCGPEPAPANHRSDLILRTRSLEVVVVSLATMKVVLGIFGGLRLAAGVTDTVGPPLLLANLLAFGCAAAVLLYSGRRVAVAFSLGVVLLLVAASFSDRPLLDLAQRWPGAAPLLVVLWRLPAEAFLPVFFWSFVSGFPPGVADFTAPQRAIRVLRHISIVVACLLFLANALLLLPAGWLSSLLSLFDRHIPGATYFWTAVLAPVVPAFPVLAWKLRLARESEKARVRLFGAGLLVGLLPAFVFSLLATPHSPLSRLLYDHRQTIGGFIYPCLLVVPVVTAYSVLVGRVLGVRVVVSRALRYALARHTVLALALTPFVVLSLYAYFERDRTIANVIAGRDGVIALAAAAAGCALLAVRKWLIQAAHLALFREEQAWRLAIERFTERSRETTSVRRLAVIVCEEARIAVQAESAGLFVKDRDGLGFVPLFGGARSLLATSAVAAVLTETRTALPVDFDAARNVVRLVPRSERQWLAEAGGLVVPLFDFGGGLLGLLTLGHRKNDLPYAAEEWPALVGFAAAVAADLELRQTQLVSSVEGPGASMGPTDDPGVECRSCRRVQPASQGGKCACGGVLVPAPLPHVLLGKFRIDCRVGVGAMGVVYRAQDLALNRTVAIKTLPRVSPEACWRLRREARVMAAVVDPGLALIFAVETWRGVPMLVVEYLDGGTLADRLRCGPLELPAALDLGVDMANVLSHTHRLGVLHRDIKPSNIAYLADGTPKLLDFGLAALVLEAARDSASESDAGNGWSDTLDDPVVGGSAAEPHLLGTPLYLSPEAIRNVAPDPSFDLWSLCVVLYESVAGRNPLRGHTVEETLARITRTELPDLRELRSDCPLPVADFFRSALAPDVRRRPATAGSLRDSLIALRRSVNS